jgi:site-specific recombinase XerD
VAESIGRYVLEHRPDSPYGNVLLSLQAPYGPLKEHSAVYGTTRRALAAAGVEGGGTLLIRHNAASKMVRAGTELIVMFAMLGHADSDSSGAYLESDEARMRMCVMPLTDSVLESDYFSPLDAQSSQPFKPTQE